ncbi:CHC2 zinc finger domain-containing protein, partial [uncultured Draconibacterium sp.]|uniref:CHC2 zinc finger domain-containing protein n=1 Tax=uncultured Draconibacterium sp. TaxID=1573823 RepID=UPI0025F8A4DA
MNISEAKQIPIESYLSRIGINPDRRDNHKHWLWYCSPIRGEKVPSFKVDQRLNLWYDHGAGTGGSILDLVIAMNDTDITGAVKILSGENISRR